MTGSPEGRPKALGLVLGDEESVKDGEDGEDVARFVLYGALWRLCVSSIGRKQHWRKNITAGCHSSPGEE